jgi:hypothetical protein
MIMKKSIQRLSVLAVLLIFAGRAGGAGILAAQTPTRTAQAPVEQQPPTQVPQAARALVPIRLLVVISRFDGYGPNARRINNLPYEVAVTANDMRTVSLRMGSQVPVPAGRDGAHTYLNVGTSIDAIAQSTDDGRFKVEVTIEDSSIIDRRAAEAQPTAVPTLRNFRINNSVVLRDGQSTQFTAATDKNNGEVVKVDVTLAVER